jgi:glycosyltransferase involved in cell wall biosynthesis
MLVSVVIPTYNRAHMVGSAIESVLNQTHQDLEIIVVDDGSTDHTEEVVRQIERQAAIPIRYLKKENGGCASARNHGLRHATGACVAFLDSDDAWVPLAIETMLSALTQAQADFAYSPAIEVFPGRGEYVNLPTAAGHPDRLAVEHFQATNVRSGAVLYKREIFDTVPGFDELLRHNEDSDLLQRVAISFKAAYSGTPSLRVVHHPGSKSRNRVAIYRALLHSAQNILDEFPDFRQTLGPIAEERLADIRHLLLEAMILAGEFQEARALEAGLSARPGALVRLSLALQTDLPLQFRRQFERAWNLARRLAGCAR